VTDKSLTVTLNGESKTFTDVRTIADLLARLELNPKFLAVEQNRELIPRTIHAETNVNEGDEIEIVTLVGGG